MAKHLVIMRRVVIFALIVVALFSVMYFSYAPWKSSTANSGQLINLIMTGFNEVHYSPKPVDDKFSGDVFTEFLKRVDFNKKIFIQRDIDKLNRYKDQIDQELNDTSFEFFNSAMIIYNSRIKDAYRYSKLPLDKPFDFNTDESIETDGDKLTWAADTNSLKNEWRKYMKLQVLQQITDDEEAQQKAKEHSDTVKIKSFAQLEEAARTKVKKSNEEFFKRVFDLDNDDWRAVYLNTIANIEDPHSEYFPPVQKQNFDIQMSGQLQGIGAQLQQRNGEISVTSIVPGSPSWKQGDLKPNDVILKVAQDGEEPVSVEGMRLDKAIQLIRGKKGTEVRLTVRKPDGTILLIPLIRDIVVLEATYAQSAIVNMDGKKIGYIRLPEFYAPVDQQGGRSSADDIRKELMKLQTENVSGIILDLRDNGGGSLQDAVKMVGLFIAKGPVVQVRPRDEQPTVMYDTDPAVVYMGPAAVMVNENSASASEILAAAMQDYHRAVIIGSKSTYGKGTVQNIFNLDNLASRLQSSPTKFGSLKITIQKFYRVSGGSTQLKGVTPDIILPDPYAEIPDGEKEDQFAIGWDEITAAAYEPWNVKFNLMDLKANSEKRVESNNIFHLIEEEAQDFKQRHNDTNYSLNYNKFSTEQKELTEKQKRYDAITSDTSLLNISNLSADLAKINADSVSMARNTQFLKNLRKDVYISETAKVVEEMESGH